MEKKSFITILLTVLMSMTGAKAFAYDIYAANSEGLTIYYNWTNNRTELSVSYYDFSSRYYNKNSGYTGNVVIPETVVYEGNTYSVTSIGNHAFEDCTGVTSVKIPNSVTFIDSRAFAYCSNLASLTIPNSVNHIGDEAFLECTGMTSITIPNSVNSIGGSAFQNCRSLSSVTLPNSITSIGDGAFWGSGLISVIIPNSVTTIGGGAFRYCNNLNSVIIGSGVTSIGSFAFGSTNLKKVIWLTNTPPSGYSNVPGKVNYVSNDQFTSLSNTVKYQFLSSYFEVEGIRYVPVSPSEKTCDAIDCVYDESAANTKIASTVAYKGVMMNVKNIQPYLAYNNKFIKSLAVDYDGELPNYAYTNCSNMQSATLGQKVSAIGSYAFQGCSSLEAVAIPDIVTVLNEYAFEGCSSLLEVKIGSQMQTINQYAFGGCIALPSITIPKAVTNIYNNVFSNCTGLKNVNIVDSESTLTFGSNGSNPIFSSCPLDYVYIGRDISYSTGSNTGYSPFYRNTTLREVKITDKETEISENEFYGCTNLQKITIGDGVTTIGKRAFSGCSSLKFFAFGSQVADIGEEAFSDCAAVVEISSKAKAAPACGSQALDDINKWECKLYVPDGCMTAYEAADQWKDFFFKEEGEGTASHGESGEQIVMKCETPTISLVGDKLSFACKTDGATFHYSISHSDVQNGTVTNNDVNLTQTYIISVYATKDGYNDSEVVKSTFKASNGLPGDVDGNGVVNVADHVKLSDIIMNQ